MNKVKAWKEMYKAAQEGDLDTVKKYIQVGVDLNFLHPEFLSTALIAAAQNGYIHVIECLIAHGADPSLKSGYGNKTAMDYARARGYLHVFDYLFKFSKESKKAELLNSFSLN